MIQDQFDLDLARTDLVAVCGICGGEFSPLKCSAPVGKIPPSKQGLKLNQYQLNFENILLLQFNNYYYKKQNSNLLFSLRNFFKTFPSKWWKRQIFSHKQKIFYVRVVSAETEKNLFSFYNVPLSLDLTPRPKRPHSEMIDKCLTDY